MKAHFTRKDTVNTLNKLSRSILRAFVLSFLEDLLILRLYDEFMLGSGSVVTSDHV